MDVKIESMIFGWDERIPEVLVKFINSVTLTKDEQELRELVKVFAQSKEFTASSLSDTGAATFGSNKGWHLTRTSAWRTAY